VPSLSRARETMRQTFGYVLANAYINDELRKLRPANGPHSLAGQSPDAAARAELRRSFLVAWARENPKATVQQAREAVRANFGVSVASQTIVEALRAARAAATIEAWQEQVDGQPWGKPLFPHVADLVQTMRARGLRRIEVDGDEIHVTIGLSRRSPRRARRARAS
jgi:hypothetical protein